MFLTAVTELTATLILVPTGVHTLATQFWAYTTNLSYGAAAPYAALLVAHRRGPDLRPRPLVRTAAEPRHVVTG